MVWSQGMTFIQSSLFYAKWYLLHLTLMFWWVFFPPLLFSPLFQKYSGRILDMRAEGWLSPFILGMASSPSRRDNVQRMIRFVSGGASPSRALAFFLSSHNLTAYFFFWISATIGPQPMIGLYLAAGLAAVLTAQVFLRLGWEQELAASTFRQDPVTPSAVAHYEGWLHHLGRDVRSLWLPFLVGIVGGGIIAAWGLSDAFFSLPEILGIKADGITGQMAGAFIGSLLSGLTFMVPGGNILVGAWLWKTHFLPYAGLLSFWLGSVLHPFTLAELFRFWGRQGGLKVVLTLWASAAAAALAVTTFWYGVDGLAAALGIKTVLTKHILGAPILPSRVPWFHIWFRPS